MQLQLVASRERLTFAFIVFPDIIPACLSLYKNGSQSSGAMLNA